MQPMSLVTIRCNVEKKQPLRTMTVFHHKINIVYPLSYTPLSNLRGRLWGRGIIEWLYSFGYSFKYVSLRSWTISFHCPVFSLSLGYCLYTTFRFELEYKKLENTPRIVFVFPWPPHLRHVSFKYKELENTKLSGFMACR